MRPRKIKRISFETFWYLKGLLKDFGQKTLKSKLDAKDLSHRAPVINDHVTKKPAAPGKKSADAISYDYEPTRIDNTRNSRFWQWRRVKEWYRYINDPTENINGHMTS